MANLIWAAELASAVDSVAAVENALSANGEAYTTISDISSTCIAASTRLWCLVGTFPDGHVISQVEGQIIANHAIAGGNWYIEGGDIWGFDPVTPLEPYDGIDGATTGDGDDSFVAMTGLDYAAALFSGLGSTYTQDQPTANDWTDRINAGTTDLAGPNAGVVWASTPPTAAYNTGVYYDANPGFGKALCQSWEFGGYGGDQDALMAMYIDALGGPSVAPPSAQFRRGDANGDAMFNIADCVYILSALFVPGSPAPACIDAADLNDDGAENIADAVYGLSALFVPGSAGPAAPHPGCGLDPTLDPLRCVSAPCP